MRATSPPASEAVVATGDAPAIAPCARTDVIGVGVDAIGMDDALAVVEGWIDRGEREYLCFATVHSVMESVRDPGLRTVMNSSGLTTADGMPLAWLGRAAGHAGAGRVCGPDFMLRLCERSAASGYRHFLYGGAPGVGDSLAERLQRRFPGLQVVGTISPPFRPLSTDEDARVVDAINAARPDVVWVALGAPKQERWVAEHRPALEAPVLAGVGAAFDFHSGGSKKAPLWMQRAGLEWLFRLSQEPGRLWYRYLVYNPAFLALVVGQHLSRLTRGFERLGTAPAGEDTTGSSPDRRTP